MASAPLDKNFNGPSSCPSGGCSSTNQPTSPPPVNPKDPKDPSKPGPDGPPDGPGGDGPNSPPKCPDCPEGDGSSGESCTDSYSKFPIRYSSGEIQLIEQDLSSRGFGLPWGQTRSYSNRVSAPNEGINGNSWFIKEVPQLVNVSPQVDPNKATMAVVGIINETLWFDYVSGTYNYTGRYSYLSTLTYDATNDLFIFTDYLGQKIKFYDFAHATRPGKFYSFTDIGGREIVASYGGNNLISSFVQTSGMKSSGYYYSYYTSGTNVNRIQYVTLKTDGTDVRRVQYDYYDGTDANGTAGDLMRAVVQQYNGSTWDDLSSKYYRYYKSGDPDGFAHGLKFVVGPLGYSQMVANGITPETALDSQLEKYAKHAFKYDANQRVDEEAVNGGALRYGMLFSQTSASTNFNVYVNKMVETLPDGNQRTVYTNFAGMPLLKVFTRVSGGVPTSDKWYEYFEYDSAGRIVKRATSAAVSSYSESPWSVTLNGTGLIHVYEYYSSTNLPSGAVAGYLRYEKVQNGSGGSAIKVKEWQYTSRTSTDGLTTIYPLSKSIEYQSDTSGGSSPAETSFSYTWQGNFFLIDQATTTLPMITTGQNGSNSAVTRKYAYDSYGQIIWVLDERGIITGYTYDVSTGGQTKRTDDAYVGTPWTPVAGPHLAIATDYTVDGLGRMTQELGASHTIDLSGTATSVKRAKWVVYQDVTNQLWVGVGYQKVSDSSFTLINPIDITIYDSGGRVTDGIRATRASTSGKLLSTDTFAQSSYVRWAQYSYFAGPKVTSRKVYYDINGLGYNETTYAYDKMRRQVREVNPSGTITRVVYHLLDWMLEKWVGTNDSGATSSDPSGGGAPGNNMVKVEAYQYDGGSAGGNGNLTQKTRYQDASNSRVTAYSYDFRDRQTIIDGEVDFYQITTYDNLGRITQVDRKNTNSGGNLIGREASNFDNRGRVYQFIRYAVDPSTGTVGNSLTDDSWFDPSGNLIKRKKAGSSLLEKALYDNLGRLVRRYACYDLTETGYPYPVSVSNDTVMQQDEFSYDAANNLLLHIKRRRFHNATGTGELNGPVSSSSSSSGTHPPLARVNNEAYWPDAIGRILNTANYGTNGGTAFVRGNTVPTRSDTVLVTTTGYNSRGEAYQVTDPKGTVNQSIFDDAGRLVQTLENYMAGGTATDQNRQTDYTYTPIDQVATLTAKNATTGDQVTQYIYGVTLSDSDIASNDLLRTTVYPDDTVPTPDRVTLAYNRSSEIKSQTDQTSTVRTFDYDKLGRIIHDRVTTLGSGVDGAIRRVSISYEIRGMVQNVTSYDNATVGSGSVVNDVQHAYNSFGQLITEYQAHSGAVNTGTSPKVLYGYANGSANTVRKTSLTYPSGRVLNYNYGSSNGMDDVLSRIAALIDDDGTTHLADYTRLGLENTVEVSSPQPGTKLTYIKQGAESFGDGGDQYTGWDRFDRVINQRWLKTSTGTALERVAYGFDRASNRQWRQNLVQTTGQDEYYTYDRLYQLDELDRGTLNGGKTAISGTPTWEEDYTYDYTGNWDNYLTKVSGSTTLNQNRTHNAANEVLTISGSSSLITYDLSGNITKAPKPTDWSTAYTHTWDAWNRLVKVMDGGSTVATYAYDGLKRRTVKVSGGVTRHYYYSQEWQILEERTGVSTSPERQFIWGLRYLDDLVLRDRSSERFYAFHDYFSCTALVDISGAVQERYGYDGFGKSRVMDASFGSRGSSNYDWETRYADYRWDGETDFYQVRNRYLHSKLGCWLSRDPLAEKLFSMFMASGEVFDARSAVEYIAFLYVYVDNSTINFVDYFGLKKVKTGVRICNQGPSDNFHGFVEVDGKGYGLYPGTDTLCGVAYGKGKVDPDDPEEASCKDYELDDCNYDAEKFKECVKEKAEKAVNKPPPYSVFVSNCRQWRNSVVSECAQEADKRPGGLWEQYGP